MRDNLGNPFFSGRPEFAKGILILEDCEGTFTWQVSGTGGDDVHEFATAAAFVGAHGMRLKTRTTGAALGDGLAASKVIAYPESGLLVCRLKLATVAKAAIDTCGLVLVAADGARAYWGGLAWSPQTPSVSFLNSAGGFTAIAALAYNCSDLSFQTMQLVINLRDKMYVSASMFGVTVDLSANALNDNGADTNRQAYAQISVTTDGAAAAEIYADAIYAGEYLDI